MRARLLALTVLLGAVVLAPTAVAQASDGAMLLIMDASGSMNADDAEGQPLIEGAKQALRDVVAELPDGVHVGLRVYGHTYPNTDRENGCTDTELIHPVEPLDRAALTKAIDGFEAKGFTPIALSLEEAAKDLPPEGPRTIVLVSDGEETCADMDAACQVAADLREDGIELIIETVGFALGDNDEARQQLECIADAGGGQFHDVDSAADLADQLVTVSTREARRFEAEGTPVEGGTFTGNAPTIEPGRWSDTIQSGETLFYRFEVTPGAIVSVQAVRGPATDPDLGYSTDFELDLVDIDDDDIAYDHSGGLESSSRPHIRGIRDVEVPEGTDELWVKAHIDPYSDEVGEFPLQIGLEINRPQEPTETLTEPTETESEPAEDPTEEETVLAVDEAATPGLPGWAVALLVLLSVAVLGLGAVVVRLLRQTAGNSG